jgi:hypothetical protein
MSKFIQFLVREQQYYKRSGRARWFYWLVLVLTVLGGLAATSLMQQFK